MIPAKLDVEPPQLSLAWLVGFVNKLKRLYEQAARAINYLRFWQEVPTGVIDGVNANFTLTFEPKPHESLILVQAGLVRFQGTWYTISGNTITFAAPPLVGDTLYAYYRY